MKRSYFFLVLIFFLPALITSAQAPKNYQWWNPADSHFPVMEGQGWPEELKGTYNRLPARVEKSVRKDVWDLSRDAAGLSIHFISNSPEIIIRYKVSNERALPHMPATGVSGVDLYAVGQDGNQLWCRGSFSFGDTIVYQFRGFDDKDSIYPFHTNGGEFTLYLPLYNTVSWMEVGTVTGHIFRPVPLRKDKPVVIYGTSIVQGGCASRPGMAWPSIAGRKLDRPLINLGFSGNGLLEKEVIAVCAEINAKLYVLDCLPNLVGAGLEPGEIKKRIIESVVTLHKAKKNIPVLLIEHAGYMDAAVNPQNRKRTEDINRLLAESFSELKAKGINSIFLLTKNEIDQDFDAMVDGIHPTDAGMLRYAEAFVKKSRMILNEPEAIFSTTKPVSQNRDANNYDWKTRHNEVLLSNEENPPAIVFMGNSILHYWGGNPAAPISRGKLSWEKLIKPHNVVNAGFGWDRIENLLWRVYHDELDGFNAKQVVLLIGTNNIEYNTNTEIIEGLKYLISAIQVRQVGGKILLLGLIQREKYEKRIAGLNRSIETLAQTMRVKYADPGKLFLTSEGKINELMFDGDGVHPNEEGYLRIAKFIGPLLVK